MNEQFKVEKGVPLPEVPGSKKEKWLALFKSMKLGDSVVLSELDRRSFMDQHFSGIGGDLVSRKIGPDQYRVWKVIQKPTETPIVKGTRVSLCGTGFGDKPEKLGTIMHTPRQEHKVTVLWDGRKSPQRVPFSSVSTFIRSAH